MFKQAFERKRISTSNVRSAVQCARKYPYFAKIEGLLGMNMLYIKTKDFYGQEF